MDKTLRTIFGMYVFAYAFFFAAVPLNDADFWWHLKTGEYIVRMHSIPKTDLFSFTNYGRPWVTHEWLSETIFYVIYSRLGVNALIIIFASLTAAAFWIAFKRSVSHPLIGGFATFLGVWSVLPTIGVRPREFTLLLSSIYLALLSRYIYRHGRAIWWLVPLMALWVNLHGGFLIGFVLIGLTIAGIFLDAWANRQTLKSTWSRTKTLGWVSIGCVLAGCLNPHGIWIYKFPFEIFLSPVQQQLVNDWLSPNFHRPETAPLVLLIFMTVGALALSPKRVRLSEVLLFLSALYMTLKSQRHVAILALVAVPLMAGYLQNWVTASSNGKIFNPVNSTNSTLLRNTYIYSLIFLLPLIVLVFRLRSTVLSSASQIALGVPVNAVEYMEKNKVIGKTFTDPNIWGGYLIWKMPSNPVYIDGRIDMYGEDFVKEYLSIILGRSDWRGPFDRYGVQIITVAPNSVLAQEMKTASDWQQVYIDEMAVVITKR
jgi:hypothetical protein